MKNLLIFIWLIAMTITGIHAIDGVGIAILCFVVGIVSGYIFLGLGDIENTQDNFNKSW